MGCTSDNKPITPYKGSWADRIHEDPLSKPSIPASMVNEDKIRKSVLKIENNSTLK